MSNLYLCGSSTSETKIENKVIYPDWIKTFYTMSEVEMDHAKNLYDMCAKYYQIGYTII